MWRGGSTWALKSCTSCDPGKKVDSCHLRLPLMLNVPFLGLLWSASHSLAITCHEQEMLWISRNTSLWCSLCHTARLLVTAAMAEEGLLKVLWWGSRRKETEAPPHGFSGCERKEGQHPTELSAQWGSLGRYSSSGIRLPGFATSWLWFQRTNNLVSLRFWKWEKNTAPTLQAAEGLN